MARAMGTTDLVLDDLVEILDSLNECDFPIKNWHGLGLRLGLKKITLDGIEADHPGDVSRCLTECLSKWLRRVDNVDRRGGATWDSLSCALKRIKEITVAEMLDKEKRSHTFVVTIFNNHHSLLLRSLSDPINVAWLLYEEHVIARESVTFVESASPSVSKQREVLLAAVKEAIQVKPNYLQTFATALCKSPTRTNVSLGQAIQDDYSKIFGKVDELGLTDITDVSISKSRSLAIRENTDAELVNSAITEELSSQESSPQMLCTSSEIISNSSLQADLPQKVPVPRHLKTDFHSIRISFGMMFYNVRESFQKKSPPLDLDKIKDFVSSCRRDLRLKMDECHSLASVLHVVEDECSLTDVELLHCVVEMFELTEAEEHIKAYKEKLKNFCKSVSVSLCLKKNFNSAHHVKSEEATYVFDWVPEEHMFDDILDIISKVSGTLMKVEHINPHKSISVSCLFPYSFIGIAILKVIENFHILIHHGLKELSIGNIILWRRQNVREEELSEKTDSLQDTEFVSYIVLEKAEHGVNEAVSSKEKKIAELKQELSVMTRHLNEEDSMLVDDQSDAKLMKDVEEDNLESLSKELVMLGSHFCEYKKRNNGLADNLRKMELEYHRLLSLSSHDNNTVASKIRRKKVLQLDDLKSDLKALTRTDYPPLVKIRNEIERLQEKETSLYVQLVFETEHKEKVMKEIDEARKKINEEQPSQKDIVSSKDEEEATLTDKTNGKAQKELQELTEYLVQSLKKANQKEFIRLLPLINDPARIRVQVTIRTTPWDTPLVEANLLHLSSRNGWLNITQDLIIKYHFDPQERDDNGNTCLHYAAVGNHVDIAEYLVTEYNCDLASNEDGNTVLHVAAANGSLDIMKYLVVCHYRYNPMATNKLGETVLHCAVEHISVVKYLIIECGCDPMATDKNGRTPLHWAAYWGCFASVQWLLSTGQCRSLARDNQGKTPLQLNRERIKGSDTLHIFKKFGQVMKSHPIDSYVNVLLLGNPGAGKSSLSHVIIGTATGGYYLGSFRNVSKVKTCIAGIIPYKLQHKTLGNIILHDFAGHSEYCSSHSAVIENLLQGSGGVFLIVVNILEKEAIKQLHQWLTVVKNEEQKALYQCHIIVVVSHVDEISDPIERRKREEGIQEIIIRERCDSVYLDCRKLGGSGLNSLHRKLSIACESIHSTSGKNLSLYCHMMYGLLEERKENILTLPDVMSAAKDNDSYILPDKREEVLDVLHSLDSTGLIKLFKSEGKVWVVVNKGILLSEVNRILFAPETFKEHVDIVSNTGIVSVSGLTRLFPDYDPDMLICFLKSMELCLEIDSSFLEMTNLIPRLIHQLSVGESEEEEGETGKRGERLLFFPCLLSSDRMNTQGVYQFGWCLQCTREHHFFPPRYFHILSLHLAYKSALPKGDDGLNRYCTFWKNGLYWFNGCGIGVLVEIVDESQCVLVLMSYRKGFKDNMADQRRQVIGEVVSIYKESCPNLEVEELVIDRYELDYPVDAPRQRTVYSVRDVMSAIMEGQKFVVTSEGQVELENILPDESLSDISNLSLLGGRDIKEVLDFTERFRPVTSMDSVGRANLLDIRDLDSVMKELTQYVSPFLWDTLGLYLGLYQPTLAVIELECRGNPRECLRECMSAWLRGEDEVRDTDGPSWLSLVSALDAIGEHHIATNIKHKYC